MINPLILLGFGLISLELLMLTVWIISRIIKNSGIVDLAWALGFTLVSLLYAFIAHAENVRQWTIGLMMIIWSLRLAWHLGMRFKRSYPLEDVRYTELKAKMGNGAEEKMLIVFLWQGAMLTLMTAPLAVVLSDSRGHFNLPQMLSVVIWLLSLVGESLADYQLSQFASQSVNKGRTCQVGLWRYSRHPNYFFEWLGSFAFFLFAYDSPYGIWTIVSPIALLYLLLNISGVKPSEEHSLHTRPDYAEYKKRTSVFVPWFRRSSS